MRNAFDVTRTTMIAGALVALSFAAAPALARGPQDSSSTSDASVPASGCTSYEKAPDGSWRPIPCVSSGPAAAIAPRNQPNRSSQASN